MRVGRDSKHRLNVNDHVRLATNEVPDGDDVCVAPVRLPVLEWLERRHPCLVERWRSDPYPARRGVRRSDAPYRRKIASSLIQAHARLVRVRSDARDVVAAKEAYDPMRLTGDRRNETAKRHCSRIAGDACVHKANCIASAAPLEQVAKDLKPRLEIIGKAVAQRQHCLTGFEWHSIQSFREHRIAQEFACSIPCPVIEVAPQVAVCLGIEVEESGKPRLVHTREIAVLLFEVGELDEVFNHCLRHCTVLLPVSAGTRLSVFYELT